MKLLFGVISNDNTSGVTGMMLAYSIHLLLVQHWLSADTGPFQNEAKGCHSILMYMDGLKQQEVTSF